MAVNLRCPNGHDRPSYAAENADWCPTCGSAPVPPDPYGTLNVGFAQTSIGPRPAPEPPAPDQPPPSVQMTLAWRGSLPSATAPVTVPGYEVLGILGRGGMGVVYKARHVKLHRTVALKMILAGELAREEELHRFQAEAEAAARLQHPNIVQLYEFGEVPGVESLPRPYFALEFVDGGSLAERLDGTPQSARESAELIETLARAMDYAHSQGVVHRDLKPANILLQKADRGQRTEDRGQKTEKPGTPLSSVLCPLSSGIPKIADFGLAKRLDSHTGATQSGAILGTPMYMAPEQAAGRSKQVGPATDVYALGAILYELLTGRPPFLGETPLETILQVSVDEPVPPRSLRPQLPRDLETITLKCLRKVPAQRYPSAAALADDLRRFLTGDPVEARPATLTARARTWARRRPALATLIAVAVLVCLGLVGIGIRHDAQMTAAYAQVTEERDRAADEHRKAKRQLVRLTVADGRRHSDEGHYLLALPWFAEALRLEQDDAERAAVHRLRLAAVLAQCPRLVSVWGHDGRVTDVAFRPDGRLAATAGDDGSVRLWDTARPHAPPRTLPLAGVVTQIAFRPDGQSLLAVAGARVCLFDLTPGAPRTLTLTHPAAVAQAVWSPDGRHVLTAGADGQARLWDAATGETTRTVAEHPGGVTTVAFSADGRRLATGGADAKARVWDAASGQPVSPAIAHAGPARVVALSGDGRRLLTADTAARLWDAETGQPQTHRLSHHQDVTDTALSPDGKLVATASLDDTGTIWDAEHADPLDELRHNSDVLRVTFSPDSALVATVSDDNTARVWDLCAAAPLTPPLPHSGSVYRAVFSPDGRSLLTASEDGSARLWELPRPRNPLDQPAGRGAQRVEATSRDGRLRVTGDANGVARVVDARTGQAVSPPLIHRGAITRVAFSPDGTRVLTASADRTARVWDWAAGQPVGEPLRHGSRVGDAVFSPDGTRVATAGDDNTARVWEAASGRPVTPPLAHAGTVCTVRFSPDGRLLLTDHRGHCARVWDAVSGEAVAPVSRHCPWVSRVLADSNADVRWELPSDERPVEELVTLAQWLSGHRVDATGGLVPLTGEELRQAGEKARAAGR